jgi:glycosyltransferase involved in cell wall biosynthesis
LIRTVDPRFGGPVEGLKDLGLVLQEMKQTVEVATLDDPDDEWVAAFPLKVHALGPGKGMYAYSKKLPIWVSEHGDEYDWVVIHGIWTFASYGAWKGLKKTKKPYVLFTHGMLDPWFKRRYPLKHLKKMVYWNLCESKVVRDAAAVLFTCEEERRLAKESFSNYRANEVVVKYGTQGPPEDPNGLAAQFRARHPEVKDDPYLIFLGRIHEKKGCDLLVNAYVKTFGGPGAPKLVFAGPDQQGMIGRLLQTVKEAGMEGSVVYAGMLHGPDKWGALAGAEAFVLPSHQENFGVAVAEALACGTPVLISDQVNIWREIQRAGAGLVEADDQAGADRLLARWRDLEPAEKEAMRIRARDCFRSQFDVREAGRFLVETLTGLHGRPARTGGTEPG